MPSRMSVIEVAAAIIVESPPQSGLAMPYANWVTILRRAGWPITMVEVDMPQREHHGLRAGQQTGTAPQSVACVPESWLRDLASRLQVPWGVACRGVISG